MDLVKIFIALGLDFDKGVPILLKAGDGSNIGQPTTQTFPKLVTEAQIHQGGYSQGKQGR
jgi:hypothetical protein